MIMGSCFSQQVDVQFVLLASRSPFRLVPVSWVCPQQHTLVVQSLSHVYAHTSCFLQQNRPASPELSLPQSSNQPFLQRALVIFR